MTAAAAQASAKHSDDLDYVLGQFFLEARWFDFGSELIFALCEIQNIEIVIINKGDQSANTFEQD